MSDDVVKGEVVTGEVARYQPAAVEEYRPRIMLAPEEAKALDDALRANMKAILRVGVDYGVIPGTGTKPSLLKPGAEKLLQWFGFGHAMNRTEVERDGDGGWVGVTYRCTVTKAMPDGRTVTVAECEGYAGYDEDRFFTTAAQAEAKERANAARYERKVNTAKFAEYRAPRNSVVKMAEKRAMVGAALQATSASSLFTQDMEDTAAAQDGFAEAADTVIREFPEPVLTALDQWYTALGWPPPGRWTTDQRCRALAAVGRIASELRFASAGVTITDPTSAPTAGTPDATPARTGTAERMAATPADDPWYDPASALPWHDVAMERAASFATEEDGRALWRSNAAARKEGRCTQAEREIVETMITARIGDLHEAGGPSAEPSAGAATVAALIEHMDNSDGWLDKVEDCLSLDDWDAARADFEAGPAKSGRLETAEVALIRQAFTAKRAELEKAAAA